LEWDVDGSDKFFTIFRSDVNFSSKKVILMLIKNYLGKIWIFDWAVFIMISPISISLFLFFDLFSFCHNVNFLVYRIIVSLMQVNLFRHFFQILQNIDVISCFSSFNLF
jgi:hypothetical protein